jgi:hypothetical protein
MASGGKTKRKRSRAERDAGEDRSVGERPQRTVAIHARGAEPAVIPSPDGTPTRGPKRVGRREVRAQIGRVVAALGDRDPTAVTLLDDLAGEVAAGRRAGKAADGVAAAVARCLDEAALGPNAAGRWALALGAAWSLAWLSHAKRPVGGALGTRLAAEEVAAATALRGGDPDAAPLLLVLAGLFPGLAGRTSVADVSSMLAADIAKVTVADGGPVAGPAVAYVARVLAWTRARQAAIDSGIGLPWDDAVESRWRSACVAALRLLGDRGCVPGRSGPESLDTAPLLTLLAESSSAPVRRTAAAVGRRRAAPSGKTLPRDAVGEGATVAVLRSDWRGSAVRLLLDFSAPRHRLEIAVRDRLVVAGDWGWSVEADGIPLVPTGPWTVCCFESDRGSSFLEIVAPLPGGLQAERQIVLLPRDGILVLTDSVTDAGACLPLSARPDRLDYRSHVPIVAEAHREEETREIRLRVHPRREWRLLPLALPEWRAASAAGSFDEDGDVVRCRGVGHGGRFSFPVWIDLDPRRADRPLTWRQLTIADQRTNLQRHEAVGFRVQVGLEQWLLYRALDTPRNRTVLGCNVACEFLVGRVRRSGEVSRTLEIE